MSLKIYNLNLVKWLFVHEMQKSLDKANVKRKARWLKFSSRASWLMHFFFAFALKGQTERPGFGPQISHPDPES